MGKKWSFWLFMLIIISTVSLINFPVFNDFKTNIFNREIQPVLGLDLRGGMQVVLEAPEGF